MIVHYPPTALFASSSSTPQESSNVDTQIPLSAEAETVGGVLSVQDGIEGSSSQSAVTTAPIPTEEPPLTEGINTINNLHECIHIYVCEYI